MAMAMAEAMTTDTRSAILPAELAAALFADAHMVTVDAGQTLFLASDPCTGSYQLIEGHLKVTLDLPSGRERILALLGPGALVGELSVIDGTPRSAGVIAIRAAKLRFARGRRRRGPAYVDGSASILERWLINRRKLSRYTTEEILRLAQQGDLLIRGGGPPHCCATCRRSSAYRGARRWPSGLVS